MRIAILEDDPIQQDLLVRTLVRHLGGEERVHCRAFSDGRELQRLLRRESFDLVILDWAAPSLDGMEVLQWLRTWKDSSVPVLMLSSKGADRDVADALNAGANDYVVKPFRPLELRARVMRLLRPVQPLAPDRRQTFGCWTLDPAAHSVSYQEAPDAPVEHHALTGREFQLMQLLFGRLGQTVSRAHLLEAAGYPAEDEPSRTLDSHIYRLRRKLQLDAERGVSLRAVYGQGYCLDAMKDAAR